MDYYSDVAKDPARVEAVFDILLVSHNLYRIPDTQNLDLPEHCVLQYWYFNWSHDKADHPNYGWIFRCYLNSRPIL